MNAPLKPFQAAQRAALLSSMLPTWAPLAACAELTPNQAPLSWMFSDEVGHKRDPDDYEWPRDVTRAMTLCAGCPVRDLCLAYGFAIEADAIPSPTDEEGERSTRPRPFGIYGGVPSPIRRHLGMRPCEDCAGTGYLDEVLGIPFDRYRWLHSTVRLNDEGEEQEVAAPGFPCATCDASGRVQSPDRIEACARWFQRWAERFGPAPMNEEEVAQ